jgi:2'-5' RNA ligase
MKYFIGYLLPREASEWHKKTAKKISNEFNTWKIYEKIPPHITIFYPEGVEDITDIRSLIKDWVEKSRIVGNFFMSGFDHFDDRVVFAKIDADESVIQSVEYLRTSIRKIAGIKDEPFPDWHPHSTLANKLSPEEIRAIWEYTSKLDKPDFVMPFNNVTIFKYEGDQRWVVDESFELLEP